MKKWVVFIEMQDTCEDPDFMLSESGIRALFDDHFGPELDASVSYKILGIEQKGAPKARSANG